MESLAVIRQLVYPEEIGETLFCMGLFGRRESWDLSRPAWPTPNSDGSTPAGSLDRSKGEHTPPAGSSR